MDILLLLIFLLILIRLLNNNLISYGLISYEEELKDTDFIDILESESLSESDIMDPDSDIENN